MSGSRAKVKTTVTKLWLDVFSLVSIRLLESDRALFEQLVSTAKLSYTSTEGKAAADVVEPTWHTWMIVDVTATKRGATKRIVGMDSVIAKSRLPDDLPGLTLKKTLLSPSTAKQARIDKEHPVLQAPIKNFGVERLSARSAGYKPQWCQSNMAIETTIQRQWCQLLSAEFDVLIY